MASQTVENYLKTIFKLSEMKEDGSLVSTNALAKELETAPASVTDMVKKLSKKKLLSYTPYQGVSLSPSGRLQALDTIRKHRLWELFLVDTLHFAWDEVHEVAEQLEHIQSHILTERLSDHLGHPTHDPHGDPIPDSEGNFTAREEVLLSEMNENQSGILVGVKTDATDLLRYLDKIGLKLNSIIKVSEKLDFDNSLVVQFAGSEQNLSDTISSNLIISPLK